MQRQTLQSLLDVPSSRGSDEAHKPRLPKTLPSGSQLPACWNEAMDRSICHMEAQNEVVAAAAMVRLLKRRFPELEGYVIPAEAVERRIETLDLQGNDYFKAGMEGAVASANAKGLVLPEYEASKYPARKFERKSDLEVFGSGAPMTGVLGYGASNIPEDEAVIRGIGNMSLGHPLKTITSSKPADRQRSIRNETPSARRVQLAGEHIQAHNLKDVTNVGKSPGLPVTSAAYDHTLPTSSNNLIANAIDPLLPVTPANAPGDHYFSSPSSKGKHTMAEGGTLPSTTYLSTPSNKDKNRSKGATENVHSAAQYISTPSGKSGKASAAGLPTGGLYRSGKENAASGQSSTTTGPSIMGRNISGMEAVMERRHQKIDRRSTADD